MAPAHFLLWYVYRTKIKGMDVNAAELVLIKWERRRSQMDFVFSSEEFVDGLSGWSHYSRPIAYSAYNV